MGVIANTIISIFLIIIIFFSIIEVFRHNKSNRLNTCFNKCTNNCYQHHRPSFFDICKQNCANSCGSI